MFNTYITEDGARISELSEERILCRWESIIVRLRFIFLVIPLVLDLKTRKVKTGELMEQPWCRQSRRNNRMVTLVCIMCECVGGFEALRS